MNGVLDREDKKQADVQPAKSLKASDIVEYLRLMKQAQDFRMSCPGLNDLLRDIVNQENLWQLVGVEWDLVGENLNISNQVQSQK